MTTLQIANTRFGEPSDNGDWSLKGTASSQKKAEVHIIGITLGTRKRLKPTKAHSPKYAFFGNAQDLGIAACGEAPRIVEATLVVTPRVFARVFSTNCAQ